MSRLAAVCAAALSLASLAPSARADAASSSFLEHQPKDRFIDLLRYRLKTDEPCVAYVTRTSGRLQVEALVVTERREHDILEIFRRALDLAAIPFKVMRYSKDSPFVVLAANWNGALKEVAIMSSLKPGEPNVVRIYSERPDLERQPDYEPIARQLPELAMLGFDKDLDREFFQGDIRSGTLMLETREQPPAAVDRVVGTLLSAGWQEDKSALKDSPFHMLHKPPYVFQVIATPNEESRGSTLLIMWQKEFRPPPAGT